MIIINDSHALPDQRHMMMIIKDGHMSNSSSNKGDDKLAYDAWCFDHDLACDYWIYFTID